MLVCYFMGGIVFVMKAVVMKAVVMKGVVINNVIDWFKPFFWVFGGMTAFGVGSATVGLEFTETFSTQTLMNASATTANWSTDEQAVLLAGIGQKLF